MGSNHLPMLRSGIVENPLDQVVAVLIAGNVDQGNASAVSTSFTNAVKVTTKEIGAANLQAFLHDLRSELVGAVLGSVANNMVDGATAVWRSTMLADMLNAPVAELTMSDDVNVGKDLLNAGSLRYD